MFRHNIPAAVRTATVSKADVFHDTCRAAVDS